MHRFIVFIAALWLTGCASNIQQRYTPRDNESSLAHVELLKSGEEPKFFNSQDMWLDALILQSRHFHQIGSIRSNSKAEDVESVRALAKKVGATVVLLNPNNVATKSLLLPSVYHSGTAIYYSNYIDKWLWLRDPNERRSAIFFANSIQKFRVGISLGSIPLDSRFTLERKEGAFINLILEDSPAFSSNLRPGDILIKVNGEQVVDASHGVQLLKKVDPLAKSLLLTVIRDGKEEVEMLNFYKL